MTMTPAQRSLRARIGGYAVHAKHGSKGIAARARKGRMAKFEQQVDPNCVLSETERKARAALAFKAHMSSLSLKAAAARSKKAAAK